MIKIKLVGLDHFFTNSVPFFSLTNFLYFYKIGRKKKDRV